MKKVFIFSYMKRHFEKIIPVIKKLYDNPDLEVITLLLSPEEIELSIKENMRFYTFENYISYPRYSVYDWDWALKALINAINAESPDLVIGMEVNYIARNAVRYCKGRNIKTLIVQHGVANEQSTIAFIPFEADKMAVWGEETKRLLVKYGVNADKLIVTGGPCFDKLHTYEVDRDKVCSDLKLDPAKKIIVFATQGTGAGGLPTPEENVAAWRAAANFLKSHRNVQLVFKVHPGQDISEVEGALNQSNDHFIICKDYITTDLIKCCDILITMFSTVALDALIMGKRLMLISLNNSSELLPYAREGAAFCAHSIPEIETILDELLSNSNIDDQRRNQILYDVSFLNDGNASDRVVTLINNMLMEK